jgi:DNA gyrase subunit A
LPSHWIVGDELGWVRLTNGKDDIIMVTENGKALRFSETVVRTMGRQAGGVAGIQLSGADRVASMEVVEPDGDLLDCHCTRLWKAHTFE